MSNKLLLIDGNNLLFRMFFGIPSRILDSEGNAIHGVIGFIGSLKKYIKEFETKNIIVVFDSEIPSSKYTEDSDYKKNRIMDYGKLPADQDPFTQLPDIKKCLSYLGIQYLEIARCEADDIIASLCERYATSFDQIIIISTDKDYYQLITDITHVLCPKGKNSILYTPQTLFDKLSIYPEKYIFFSSLVGDKSDNITGIYGIGKITAAKIVNQFSSIDDLYLNLDKLSPSIYKKITNQKELLLRNTYLITMDKHLNVHIPDYATLINNQILETNTVDIIYQARKEYE